MSDNIKKRFSVSADSKSNLYARYTVIMCTLARRGLVVAILFAAYMVYVFVTDFQGELSRAYEYSEINLNRYLNLFGICIFPFLTPFLLFLLIMFSREKTFSEKYFKWRTKSIEKEDLPSCASIHFRTMYHYCASLEMNGKEMIVRDKVIGLVNGHLRVEGVGEKLKDGFYQFNLSVDQIVAMWVARDVVILRFCWGTTYREVWDVILSRALFFESSDREFIRFVSENIKREELTYDVKDLALYPGNVRLANKSTNLSWPWKQRRVKICHCFWGPFKGMELKRKVELTREEPS